MFVFQILGLAIPLIIAILLFFYFALQKLKISKETIATILTVNSTLFISSLGITIGNHYENRASIEQAQRERKIEIYEGYISTWIEILYLTKQKDKKPNEQEIADKMVRLNSRMMLWSSEDLIMKYNDFRMASQKKEAGTEIVWMMEEVFREMRKELGYNDQNLRRGDLFNLYVNGDINQLAN